jgi:invasion protein IalB
MTIQQATRRPSLKPVRLSHGQLRRIQGVSFVSVTQQFTTSTPVNNPQDIMNVAEVAAQREACEAYILSQRHEGWQVDCSKPSSDDLRV